MNLTNRPLLTLLVLASAGSLLAATPPMPNLAPPTALPPGRPPAASPASAPFEAGQVATPTRRASAVAAAKKLLTVTEHGAIPNLVDPFHSDTVVQPPIDKVPDEPGKPPKPGPKVDDSSRLIRAIAAALKPSGHFVIGGEPNLVFGQKRVKAGGHLSITFEGTAYTVDITAITNTTFTLSLNGEEYTRPIK